MPFVERILQFEPTPGDAAARRWIYVPYDRLHEAIGPLADTDPQAAVLVFLESRAKATRRPYHKKKLTLVLSAMRHFALEQAERGCRIVYGASASSFADGLLELQAKWNWSELLTNVAAERELRVELRSAEQQGLRLRIVPDTAWLTTTEDFERIFGSQAPDAIEAASPRRRYLMDTFYRAMRRKTGYLIERGKPMGGKWSHDAANRKPWRGQVAVPRRPTFAPDDITREVIAMIDERHPEHFGTTDGFDLPVTRADAETAWKFALTQLLPHFGPWEDAMSTAHPDLFHSMTSPALNLSLLLPRTLVEDAVEAHAQGLIPI
jgi:deoxyribodipyrimidine photolyase-related protein